MASNRLTWQNVNGPDYGSSMRGAEAANRMFQDALGGLNTSLGSFITNRKDIQNEALLKQQQEAEAGVYRQWLAVSDDPEAQAALRKNLATLPNLSNDFMKNQLTDFRNSMGVGNRGEEDLRQTVFDNDVSQREQIARERAQPLQARILQHYASGDEKGAQQLQAEYESQIAQLSLEDQEKLFKAASGQAGDWQTRRTSELGRDNTRLGMDQTRQTMSHADQNQGWKVEDRSEKRVVEDLVGAARAETPFIDDQQALIANYYRNGDITPRMYEQASQLLQQAASGGSGGRGTGGGGTGAGAGGTPTGGGNTLIDPRPSPLDPNNPHSTQETQDIVQDVNNLVTDLTRGAGTVANRGAPRSDRAREEDISPSEAVTRVMQNEAFKNADPVAVQYAIYDVMNMGEGNHSFAEAADIVAMSPSRGSTFYRPSTWFTNKTLNEEFAQDVSNQWTSTNLSDDRETLQENQRAQAKLKAAEEKINRKGQKLDEMVNHAFRNGLSQDSPAIRDLQAEIQLDFEDLGIEAERIRENNLGERVRNPSTGGFDYPDNIREEEAKAARSRAEAQTQAEEDAQIATLSNRHLTAKDAQRIKTRMEELEQRWGKDTLLRSNWDNGVEYRRLRSELNRTNKVLRDN